MLLETQVARAGDGRTSIGPPYAWGVCPSARGGNRTFNTPWQYRVAWHRYRGRFFSSSSSSKLLLPLCVMLI